MLIESINQILRLSFESLNFEPKFAFVTPSDRPDISDFQCNAAFKLAKSLRKPPKDIANSIKESLQQNNCFSQISVDGPGFLNLKLSDAFLIQKLKNFDLNSIKSSDSLRIIIDYGGFNVAKPLHVGHLRSTIIGDALKKIATRLGHKVITDVHLGDWGTPMGMIIAYLRNAYKDSWPFFNKSCSIDNAQGFKLPINVDDLNDIYPKAAKLFKENEDFASHAREITAELHKGDEKYFELWKKIVSLSIARIKKDLLPLDIDFDLWMGESDAQQYIDDMMLDLKNRKISKKSDGAQIIEVEKESDRHAVPPLMLQKQDGGVTYATTDLATIIGRTSRGNIDKILYVVDKRQKMHFLQLFRAATISQFIKDGMCEHIEFGTMNGPDGKPFKTRDGGVMQLSDLIKNAKKIVAENAGFDQADDKDMKMIEQIAISAIKFSDLMNPRASDYIFDVDSAMRLEGKTGPYIQYAVIRIKSILSKLTNIEAELPNTFSNNTERNLVILILSYHERLILAFERRAPSDLCEFIYHLSQEFSSFYDQAKILKEPNPSIKKFRTMLIENVAQILTDALNCIGICVPDKMLRNSKK